jgi:hypothetical protein
MKKLKVDVEDIAMIMDNQDRFGSQYYLDRETGEAVVIPNELMSAIDGGEPCDGLPDWELELVPVAREISRGSERYDEIPTRAGGDGHRVMVDFTSTVKDARLRSRLESAIHGRGAFRRFKDTLREFPKVEEQWFRLKAERDKEDVKDWLESIGIKLAEKSEKQGGHCPPARKSAET